MIRFFTSIKTSIVFFCTAITFFFAGTLIIPKTMELYTNIIDTVLFDWLRSAGPAESWWIYGIVVSIALIAINTIVCSIDALLKKLTRKDFLKVLSPQVIHLGVLLILMGHLMTSAYGLREEALVTEGEPFTIAPGPGFVVEKIRVETDERGETLWEVKGTWKDDGATAPMLVRPSKPSYYKGLWLFIKSADTSPRLSAILMVRRDAGAYWAFAGMVVFTLGCAILLYSKEKRSGLP